MEPNAIIQILIALLLKSLLREEGTGLLGQALAEVGSEGIGSLMEALIEEPSIARDLFLAEKRAHDCFLENCHNKELAEWAISLPLVELPGIREVLTRLPSQQDESELKVCILRIMKRDWKSVSETELNKAIEIYIKCLNISLLPIRKQSLMIIGRSVLRTEDKIDSFREWLERKIENLERGIKPTTSISKDEIIKSYLDYIVTEPFTNLRSGPYRQRKIVTVSEKNLNDSKKIQSNREENSIPLSEMLFLDKNTILLGEPGIGKTIALQSLAKFSALLALEDRGRIPIYVELKYYQGEPLDIWLATQVEMLSRVSKKRIEGDPDERIDVIKKFIFADDRKFIFLLDGLNEVPKNYRLQIRSQINNWCKVSQNFVVSCRIGDYDKSLTSTFRQYELLPLGSSEISTYLVDRLGIRGREIFASIFRNKRLLSLATNPLMLWMISIVAELNEEIYVLYERGLLIRYFVDIMPIVRREEVVVQDIHPAIVKKALVEIAYLMFKDQKVTANFDEILEWNIPTSGKDLSDILSQAKDWRWLKSDGWLDESVEFQHQLFLEYFVAEYLLKRLSDKKSFDEVIGNELYIDDWHEVILMLSEIYKNPIDLFNWMCERSYQNTITNIDNSIPFLIHNAAARCGLLDDPRIRKLVINVLVDALKNTDYPEDYIEALRKFGKEVTDSLINVLVDDKWHYEIFPFSGYLSPEDLEESNIVYAMVELGEFEIEKLFTALESEDEYVKIVSIVALGEIRDLEAITALSHKLSDSNHKVIKQAEIAIGKILEYYPEDLEHFAQEIMNSLALPLELRSTSSEVESKVKKIFFLLHIPNENIEEYIIQYIPHLRPDDQIIKTLIYLLGDVNTNVQLNASLVLTQVIDAFTIHYLIFALDDQNMIVRWHTEEVLQSINKHLILNWLDDSLWKSEINLLQYARAMKILGKFGNSAEAIIEAFSDNDEEYERREVEELMNMANDLLYHFQDNKVSFAEEIRLAIEKARKKYFDDNN